MRTTILLACCGSLLMLSPSHANDVRQFSLERKVADSNVVFIGTAKAPELINGFTFSKVKPITVLKGSPEEEILVLVNGGIAELVPRCCEAGKSYLFFLEKYPNGYHSVNGEYGIYEVP